MLGHQPVHKVLLDFDLVCNEEGDLPPAWVKSVNSLSKIRGCLELLMHFRYSAQRCQNVFIVHMHILIDLQRVHAN